MAPLSMKHLALPPSAAWTLVFFPALCYFLATRMTHAGFRFGSSYSLGQAVTDRIRLESDSACDGLAQLFYLSSCDSSSEAHSKYALQLVQEKGLQGIVATTWRHDSELGRGYLLLSDATASGNIWRWEVGGGPIAIGRTLHLEKSGCRSNRVRPCPNGTTTDMSGSGGIAIDFYSKERSTDGRLVVAEYGEGRIIRLEETGARTPLVIQVPDICNAPEDSDRTSNTKRIHEPRTMLYTPRGDLLFIDHQPDCQRAAVFQLRYAVHVKALASLQESRQAHEWESVPAETTGVLEILYQDTEITQMGGMALTPTFDSLCISAKIRDSVVLLLVPLTTDLDEEEDDEDGESTQQSREVRQMINLTQHIPSAHEPGSIAISQDGHVFAAINGGIAIVDSARGIVLGTIEMNAFPTSLTLGEDGFLYISTFDNLYRMAVRAKPVKTPTNMVRRLPKEEKRR